MAEDDADELDADERATKPRIATSEGGWPGRRCRRVGAGGAGRVLLVGVDAAGWPGGGSGSGRSCVGRPVGGRPLSAGAARRSPADQRRGQR